MDSGARRATWGHKESATTGRLTLVLLNLYYPLCLYDSVPDCPPLQRLGLSLILLLREQTGTILTRVLMPQRLFSSVSRHAWAEAWLGCGSLLPQSALTG